MQTFNRLALASLALLALGACGDRGEKSATGTQAAPPAAAPDRTLAQVLKADDAHGALAKVVDNAGLGAVFEGVGPYTMLAPPDAAIARAGGVDLTDAALKAEGAALLRAHILPGALTRADIAAAVGRAGAKGAQMRTMAGDLLTFTGSADALVVAAPDGSTARLTGQEILASNGVLQPVDALVIKPAAATN